MTLKQMTAIALIVLGGAAGALYLMQTTAPMEAEENDHEHAAHGHDDEETARGPHRGRWFAKDDFGLEVTIYETGIPPEFRLFLYAADKSLPPTAATVTLELKRLGRAPQTIRFSPQEDYLRGDAEIVEPHSFEVLIAAHYRGKDYAFAYQQEEARTRLTDEEAAHAEIGIETAGPVRIEQRLLLPGEIRLNGDRLAHVVSPLDGVAVSVHVNAGEKVAPGALLAIISSKTLALMRHALTEANAEIALARRTYEREKQLWQDGIAPEQDYRQAENRLHRAEISARSAQEQLSALGNIPLHQGHSGQFELRAPIGGTVIDKHLAIGEGVSPEIKMFTIADLSTVWAEAKVGARELARVRTGQLARIEAAAPARAAEGQISYLSALIGEQDRAVTARVVLDNPDDHWRPGLPLTMEIITGAREVPVAVALEALQTLRDWQVVFGRYGEYFEARPLELGERDERFVEVIAGLNAGERYAARNSYLIKADIGKAGASHDH